MKAYTTPFLRNVGIVGHGDTGKTQLVSSLLFTAGMTPRLGKVAEGKHGHRLGRRRDRAQDLHPDRHRLRGMGAAAARAAKRQRSIFWTRRATAPS